MRKMRTLDEIEVDYFSQHPEEIEEYISVVFEEYEKDGDIGAFLASLRTVEHTQGTIEPAIPDRWTKLQQELSNEESPKFESVKSIMNFLGYRLVPQKIMAAS
jgi:DNA-binding phage protein